MAALTVVEIDAITGERIERPMTKEESDAYFARIEEVSQASINAQTKREKDLALKSIKVTVNGKEFDGHESARLNMTNALMVSGFTGQTQTNWKLADNTVAQVTLGEVQQALALSIQKVGEIIGAV